MRISVDERDPGCRAYREALAQGYDFVVTLDGERVTALTADDVAGEIVRPALGPGGSWQVDPQRPGEILKETVRGRVKIVRRWKAK